MSRFQILSLSGGGIRGEFIISFLNDLEQKLGRPIAESFDLIAGTSTGAIIAAVRSQRPDYLTVKRRARRTARTPNQTLAVTEGSQGRRIKVLNASWR